MTGGCINGYPIEGGVPPPYEMYCVIMFIEVHWGSSNVEVHWGDVKRLQSDWIVQAAFTHYRLWKEEREAEGLVDPDVAKLDREGLRNFFLMHHLTNDRSNRRAIVQQLAQHN